MNALQKIMFDKEVYSPFSVQCEMHGKNQPRQSEDKSSINEA